MKVLILKTSSMGDVIHCLPAVTDLLQNFPDAIVDWVVEEGLQDIPAFHPGVRRVIPIAIRRWRKRWLAAIGEIRNFRRTLRAESYDQVIDAQGLVKSALVAGMAKGPVAGFDRQSAREPVANFFYGKHVAVVRDMHAIERQRKLFAQIFDYQVPAELDYGLRQPKTLSSKVAPSKVAPSKDIVFFHSTTWASKHWPDQYWLELAQRCADSGYQVVLPYVDSLEQARAETIAASVDSARTLPPGSLLELGRLLVAAAGAVSVDTGLGHLSAAFNVPLVAVYGPTSSRLTGIVGPRQASLADPVLDCAPCLNRNCQYSPDSSNIYPPCFETVTPERVFQSLLQQMAK
ncbi:MAG: heptosyltransferase-1 [Candidatus Azotimanducaceae bacterium]|jgi:heptosyltransferase-1